MSIALKSLTRWIGGDRVRQRLCSATAALVVAALAPSALAYQIPVTPAGFWTGPNVTTSPGNQVDATKDTVSALRTTVSVTGMGGGSISQGIVLRNNTTLLMSNNTTVPLLPAAANGLQLVTRISSCQTRFSTSLTCTGLGTTTIAFTDAAGNPVLVRNPRLQISRMGGSIGTTVITATYTLTTPGATLGAPAAGSVNLTVTGGTAFQGNLATMSTTGVCPNAGCGTIPVTGTVSSLTFNIGP